MTLAPSGFGTQPFGASYLGAGLRDLTLTVGPPRGRTVTARLETPVNLSRIETRFITVPVTLTDTGGEPVDVPAVDVALLPPRHTPTADTAWTTATHAGGAVTALIAGPDAAALDGALTIPAAGADLWVRVVDSPELLPALAGRITVR